ncbi:uncharacterized protein [Apostichopus japonicus]|uniref:uncharacterized protein n=1 Tax=Stichopus japonicus TaxID=307972 RepID=UPI003AB757B2
MFRCICPVVFTGTLCESLIEDSCSSDPCRNGGNCVVGDDSSYQCQCVNGWTGTNCAEGWFGSQSFLEEILFLSICLYQYFLHLCHQLPLSLNFVIFIFHLNCLDYSYSILRKVETFLQLCFHAKCHPLSVITNFLCTLTHTFCCTLFSFNVLYLDECSSSPCVNGICLNEGNMFRCICPVVFTGTLCESLIEDSCSSNPCRNGGNCVVGDVSSYQCQCVNGWTGTNCAEDLDECSSSPCVNGFCLNEGNMFRCICPVVFTGTLCESLIEDSCSSDPCRNGGNCVVGDDSSYQCQCVNGWTGTNCAEDLDECSSSPCVNGFCLNEGNMFRCICPVVFTGTLCESLIEDSCSSDPCRNGGNCVVGDDSSYQCQCVNGWTGTNCAEDLDECSSSPCVNGFCLNEGNMFRCICPVVFTGTLCESLIEDSCSSDPCRNGGNCVVGDDSSYQCQCVNGWTGTNCAEDLDECSSSPCVNGFCLNEGNMFRCICPVVFTGTLCESLIEDSCSSDPCRNGGNCVVGDDSSYQCQCVNGWTGTNCAEDLDECSSSPCVNGICLNEGNMFRCICPVVFTGTLCESLIEDSCSSDPCRNGGNCVVGDDSSYECQCVNGWTGTNCAEDLDECSSSPCVNGFCLNEGNMFRCICPVVFTGTLCESLIEDSCSSDPCRNGGNCVVGDDSSYQCQCVNGWTGTNCAEGWFGCQSFLEKILFLSICLYQYFLHLCHQLTLSLNLIEDSCSSDPCRNGGNCVVGDDSSYQCQCVNGWTGTNCAEDLDECSSSPCVNGFCLNEGNIFRCVCPVVFTGTLCESLIEDSCSSDPCRNRGNCVVGDDSSYQCQCVNGWTGTNCAEDLDECSSSPCVNGFCLNEGNMFRCICPVVFTGTLCESLIEDSCSSDPCRNGGNCVVGDDSSYQCQCVNGWTGTNCAEDLDECSSSPCVNGFCLNEGNMFRCICPVVFTGTLCESLIEDSCSSDPCRNGGNCVVGDDSSYQCQCVNGWTGTNCAEDLDECSSSPCVNGFCLNEGNMFRCICPVVFTGTLCESLIEDSCSSDPCRNGGNCVVGDDSSYQCQCVNGWTGTNCAEDLDECSSSPCVNGFCLNEGNMFRCICPVVFTGTLCESLIEDSCSSDPCRNGGNCVVGDDSSYQCQCVNGWTGTNCAEAFSAYSLILSAAHYSLSMFCSCSDLDECSSSPCVNGFCLNEGNMFRCICPVVFTGTLCESLIEDSCSSDPCRNGGNCVVGDDSSYQCQCVNGWTGTNCAAGWFGHQSFLEKNYISFNLSI